MTTDFGRPTRWSPEAYATFAARQQVVATWQLAVWIRARSENAGVSLGRGAAVLDAGAGPAHLSHAFATLTGCMVRALVQNDAFLRAAAAPALPPTLVSTQLVAPFLDRELALEGETRRYPLVFSYACLHESMDRAGLIVRLANAVAPGGLLLVVDTMSDALPHVRRWLARGTQIPAEAPAIRATFQKSLSLAAAREMFRRVLPHARVEMLEIADEILLESALTLPDGVTEAAVASAPAPTLFYAEWRAPGHADEVPQ